MQLQSIQMESGGSYESIVENSDFIGFIPWLQYRKLLAHLQPGPCTRHFDFVHAAGAMFGRPCFQPLWNRKRPA